MLDLVSFVNMLLKASLSISLALLRDSLFSFLKHGPLQPDGLAEY